MVSKSKQIPIIQTLMLACVLVYACGTPDKPPLTPDPVQPSFTEQFCTLVKQSSALRDEIAQSVDPLPEAVGQKSTALLSTVKHLKDNVDMSHPEAESISSWLIHLSRFTVEDLQVESMLVRFLDRIISLSESAGCGNL